METLQNLLTFVVVVGTAPALVVMVLRSFSKF